MKVGDTCVTKGTRFLAEGTRVELIYLCPQFDDGKPPKWKVKVDGRTGLDAYWYVREDCLEAA